MQSDLVIASDRNFNLATGIAEEVLRIVVGQIAGIVLVNFGNYIATQEFLLCRTVYLNPGDNQRSVEIGSTNQPDSPRNLRRITCQYDQELVWLRTHCCALLCSLNSTFLSGSGKVNDLGAEYFQASLHQGHANFSFTQKLSKISSKLKISQICLIFSFLSFLSLLYHLLGPIFSLFLSLFCFSL